MSVAQAGPAGAAKPGGKGLPPEKMVQLRKSLAGLDSAVAEINKHVSCIREIIGIAACDQDGAVASAEEMHDSGTGTVKASGLCQILASWTARGAEQLLAEIPGVCKRRMDP
jgi:hypothetical protein